jgi:hypothetical protein
MGLNYSLIRLFGTPVPNHDCHVCCTLPGLAAACTESSLQHNGNSRTELETAAGCTKSNISFYNS